MGTRAIRTRSFTWATLIAAAALVGSTFGAPTATAAPKDRQPMHSFATGEAIEGTFAHVDRTADAVTSSIRTAATPGHVVTIWYVIFNEPTQCNTGACGDDDIFIDGVPANGFDFDQINAARISVVYGGDGAIVNPGGRVALDGGLAQGQVPTGSVPVVIGDQADGALVPGPVTGLEDAAGAELHIVLQDHGWAHTDADRLADQLTGFQTECNPACEDVQFSVHKG